MPSFIHLQLHTEYSIVDGLVTIKPLMQAVKKMGMPAVAMTDQCNLFALVKFYRAAMAAGIKPIIGVDIYLHNETAPKQPFRMQLLCQNRGGYRNITRLLSKAYLEGQHDGKPIVRKDWLAQATEGVIVLSGGREGDVGQALIANNKALAKQRLSHWLTLFPNRFYCLLQRTGRLQEEEYNRAVIQLAEQCQAPVVASNGVCFLNPTDFEAHEARVCIHQGRTLNDPQRPKRYSEQQFLRTPEEMLEVFADIPEALENTVEIAKRCNLELKFGDYYLPEFPVPKQMTLEKYFNQQAQQGLTRRLEKLFTNAAEREEKSPIYQERLHMELTVISSMGFAGYFLIVADFIRWAKQNHIPVGPGRGSGAGSLVAYALGITDVDPIAFDLLFERFLNPERVSMPDFDIDFCMEGRDRVIDYVAQTYGRDSVSQIITYGTMAAKAVVRDVGRVLGHPYGFVDKIAKLIPFELGITLKKALQQEEVLAERYHEEEEVKILIDLAAKLEGITRNAGKHAGGVVIAPSQLTDFTPLYCEPDGSNLVTQFDKDDVETVGLVKFDFLGLRTLTIIHWTLQTINTHRSEQEILDLNTVAMDDEKTFELLRECKTTAVFQLESRGMKDLIRRLQPDCFRDIIQLGALFRPGPLQAGVTEDFINRRHGRAEITYMHPKLEPVLRPTYGVILYQEQVMQIAQVLAGYSLGKADILRRAMGKKKPEEMAKQRAIFVDGATKNGVDGHLANTIFDLMEKFAGYGFNKSHSTAYALLSYQTAWLKAHYPAEFMAAVLSSDMDNTDKVVALMEECKSLGLNVGAPDINASEYKFTVNDAGHVVYGLGAIKGVGESAVEEIIKVRSEGRYQTLFELCSRVDTRKVNRRGLESLARAGALDGFAVHRASLMLSIDAALQLAEQQQLDQTHGQQNLFGDFDSNQTKTTSHYVPTAEWSDEQRLKGEKESLGLYFTGHPIEQYQQELSQFLTAPLSQLRAAKDKTIVAAGYVVSLRAKNTRRGRIAFLGLDDRSARMDLVVYSEAYNQYRDLLVKDQLLIVEGEVSEDDFTGGNKITAQRLFSIEQARHMYGKRLVLKIQRNAMQSDMIAALKSTLNPYTGGSCPVFINYSQQQVRALLSLGDEWKVNPSAALLQQLQQLIGDEQVVIQY